jgi:hypothetical protein
VSQPSKEEAQLSQVRSIDKIGELRSMNFYQLEIAHKVKIRPKLFETTEISLRVPMDILHSTKRTVTKIIPRCCFHPFLQESFVSHDRIWSLDKMKV